MQAKKLKAQLKPAQFTMLSFLSMSLIGTFLLMLPISNTNGQYLDFIRAFFMSVSSVCVTGLSVLDLSKDLSLFGQIVILILIQIGGLSYMTISTFFIYLVGKKISYREAKAFNFSNNSENKIDFADFVIKIGLFTLIIEGFGFLFLLYDSLKRFAELHPNYSPIDVFFNGAFHALFHSISAFCNAGLSLYTDSLCSFRDNYWVLFSFSFLTILGGLGYTVLNELSSYFSKASSTRFSLSLHTRVSLYASMVLLCSGFLIQLALIYLQDFSRVNDFLDNAWIAFFQTCAARSSGFNSINLAELGDPSLIFLSIWMFIGTCPGGTGGGIKVTTLMIVLVIIWSGLRNSEKVKLFNRSISENYQKKAIIVFVSTIFFMALAVWFLSIFESGRTSSFIDQFFEVVSAFATVGLSTGITNQLSEASLLVLSLCMLIGRPGPLLFLLAFVEEHESREALYPEEGVLIG
jgi:trk system potassium uptake protein